MMQFRQKSAAGSKKALVAGLLLAVMMAYLVAARPAHAESTFTVNLTGDGADADIDDNSCDANEILFGFQCTLRAAIEEANDTPGADEIRFAIPDDPNVPGAEVKTIEVGATGNGELPTMTEAVNIDGYTQPGASPNTLAKGNDSILLIELNGESAGDQADGLIIYSPDSVVKGLVINRFKRTGVVILSNSDGNKVQGNYIGTDKSGTGALGNTASGVMIQGTSNTVGSNTSGAANTIAFNGVNGVGVSGSTGNRILRNSVFSNGSLGIDLNSDGITPNDGADDPDAGPNELQNFPLITRAKTSGSETTIRGRLSSSPGETFRVRFFSNPPGGDEGKKYIGQKKVTTGSDGMVSFTFEPQKKIPVGRGVTATATDEVGSTSEFSAPRPVTAP